MLESCLHTKSTLLKQWLEPFVRHVTWMSPEKIGSGLGDYRRSAVCCNLLSRTALLFPKEINNQSDTDYMSTVSPSGSVQFPLTIPPISASSLWVQIRINWQKLVCKFCAPTLDMSASSVLGLKCARVAASCVLCPEQSVQHSYWPLQAVVKVLISKCTYLKIW